MRTFTVTLEHVKACPIQSLLPSHYNDDGSCKCPEPMPALACCPGCGEAVVLVNRCVHEHHASIFLTGELDWQAFDSEDCGAGNPPTPENFLYCESCDWESEAVTVIGDAIDPEALRLALRLACSKCGERYEPNGDGESFRDNPLCGNCADAEAGNA